MGGDVVGRTEAFAVPGVGDQSDRSVMLVANDTSREVLARQLTAFEVEGVAVAVVCRKSVERHAPVVVDPSPLPVVRDVAEDEEAAHAVPRRTFEPEAARP